MNLRLLMPLLLAAGISTSVMAKVECDLASPGYYEVCKDNFGYETMGDLVIDEYNGKNFTYSYFTLENTKNVIRDTIQAHGEWYKDGDGIEVRAYCVGRALIVESKNSDGDPNLYTKSVYSLNGREIHINVHQEFKNKEVRDSTVTCGPRKP